MQGLRHPAISSLLSNSNMVRRIYLGLRMLVAFALWLWFAFLLARVGIVASPTERSYSWQELRKWALNPGVLTLTEEHKFNLKYSLPVAALLSSGVAARFITGSLPFLLAWGAVSWAVSMVLVSSYTRKKGHEAIMAEYGFGRRGVLLLHTFIYLPSFGFVVFATGQFIRIL